MHRVQNWGQGNDRNPSLSVLWENFRGSLPDAGLAGG